MSLFRSQDEVFLAGEIQESKYALFWSLSKTVILNRLVNLDKMESFKEIAGDNTVNILSLSWWFFYLKVAAATLFIFDGLKQSLEITGSKTLMILTLNDFNKLIFIMNDAYQCRSIFYRFCLHKNKVRVFHLQIFAANSLHHHNQLEYSGIQ